MDKPIRTKQAIVNLGNARVQTQAAAMERIAARGKCPFCTNELSREHAQKILTRGRYWLITKNQWPYEGTRDHFLLIFRTRHIERLSEIPGPAWRELGLFAARLERTKKIQAGGLCLRFGDTRLNGATVAHLHAHIIVPRNGRGSKKVRFSLGRSG